MNNNYRSMFSGAVVIMTLGCFSPAGLAQEAPADNQFPVQLTVSPQCTATTPASLDFGTRSGLTNVVGSKIVSGNKIPVPGAYPSVDGSLSANKGISTQYMGTSLQFQCTKGATYKVTFVSDFAPGQSVVQGGDSLRYLTRNGSKSGLGLGYYLRAYDPYKSGTGIDMTSQGYTGPAVATGASQSIPIYATIDTQHWNDFFNSHPIVGDYFDTVTVTVEAIQ